jgi:hypothetical protein
MKTGAQGGIEEGDHALVGDEGLDVGEGPRGGGTVPATARQAKAHRGVDGRGTQLALEPVADPDQDAAPHAAQEAEHCRGTDREHGQPEQGAVGAAGQHTVEELHQVDGAHECQEVDGEAEARDRPELAPDCATGAAHERGRLTGPQLLPRRIGGVRPLGIQHPAVAGGPGGFHDDRRSPRLCRQLHSATPA